MDCFLPGWYPYVDVVVGLAWSEDLRGYVNDSIATGKASHAGQVKGDDPDQKGCPGLPGRGLGVRPTPTPKTFMSRKPQRSF
jgi:hypothetical protein